MIAQVHQIELLLIYKIKALCDRRYDLQHSTISAIDKSYINSKIWKDEYDINKLSECKVDKEKLISILDSTIFKDYFQRELKRMKINIL